MNANVKRYYKEFGGAMAAYTVAVPISIGLLDSRPDSPVRLLFAVLPVIPAAFAMWACIRFFHGLDELERRIQFEGMIFSFLGTCLITLTWGFLQHAGLLQMDVIYVAPLLVALWGFGMAFARRRYR